MAEVNTKFNVALTQDFRLTADSDCFVLERRLIVDPTKAPGFAARLAANPALDTAKREAWGDPKYYTYSAEGLTAAINNAVIRTAVAEGAQDLAEFLRKIRSEMDRITALVDSVLSPRNVPVKFSEMSEEEQRQTGEAMRKED